jgi:biopolymer transport protein ExbB
MESQFGLAHVWQQGDLVTKGVAALLLIMSLASWIVILIKALDIFMPAWPTVSGTAKTSPPAWRSWAKTPAIRFCV